VPFSVIGGAMLPHAPQFFTMPETEDSATVARIKEVAHEIGNRLQALKPYCGSPSPRTTPSSSFTMSPAFTVHVGGSASGGFAGRPFHWRVPGETGFEIVRKRSG
jgi:2,3-dihydroxyphenylpropionate 1,2-dioxygenase